MCDGDGPRGRINRRTRGYWSTWRKRCSGVEAKGTQHGRRRRRRKKRQTKGKKHEGEAAEGKTRRQKVAEELKEFAEEEK